ncbi:MAG: helix-turn-helix domain-containing protein [Chloracidobacterium sp.]|nr:helix-turn-helix domain-containing protein [Chloracidobacterium sp.]
MSAEFTERLKIAFDHAKMADIARRLDLPHATIRNYFRGRMPAPEVLIKIANETHVSLNWLLTGSGEMFAPEARRQPLDEILEDRVTEIVRRVLAERQIDHAEDLGSIDAPPKFDVESAVLRYDDPEKVMSEWFLHEGREYPADFGVVFFRGWGSFTFQERLDAVRDAKKVLDRTLRAMEPK